MSTDSIFQKFRDKFLEEANTLLDKFETDILELEKSPDNTRLSESVFRTMHTIKGISAMYGFEHISEYTHFLENIFQNLHDGKIRFSKEISEISLLSIDHIHKLLNDEKLENSDLKKNHHDLLAQVNKIASIKKDELPVNKIQIKEDSAEVKTWYIIINTTEQMFFRGINIQGICRELFALGKYKIVNIPFLNSNNCDSWGIVLATKTSEDDIREVIMFIEDECSLFLLSDVDIFNVAPEASQEMAVSGEPSITAMIEKKNASGLSKEAATAGVENDIEKQTVIRQKSKRISVETVKLDNLMYLVSQLITLNSQFSVANQERDYQKQHEYIEMLDSLSKQFRTNALEIRLVPLADLALRFQRLVRDLSKSLGKKIDFVTDGIDTEIDKNTIDIIGEPIMHLIRNCADHGIEDSQTRLRNGKSETGIIKLSASYSGNYILIRIEDDGAGIDLEKIRRKAVEKGILAESDKPTEQELFNIIFLPGFSTAMGLSEVSGRGVGMDIVKKKIAELRGTVVIESKKGKGTTFIIKLNQSMSITDTLLFKVQDNYFITPISEILSCNQVEMSKINDRSHTSTIQYQNELIPFIDLRNYLNLEGSYKEKSIQIIVHNGDQSLAILADKIIGEHQAVLKPLNKTFDSETIISSVSQLGNGQIAFLIDTGVLNKQIAS